MTDQPEDVAVFHNDLEKMRRSIERGDVADASRRLESIEAMPGSVYDNAFNAAKAAANFEIELADQRAAFAAGRERRDAVVTIAAALLPHRLVHWDRNRGEAVREVAIAADMMYAAILHQIGQQDPNE